MCWFGFMWPSTPMLNDNYELAQFVIIIFVQNVSPFFMYGQRFFCQTFQRVGLVVVAGFSARADISKNKPALMLPSSLCTNLPSGEKYRNVG